MPTMFPSLASVTGSCGGTATPTTSRAAHAVAPLVISELPRAALAFPIAFTTRTISSFRGHAGLAPGQNSWWDRGAMERPLHSALYRAHPFVLAPSGAASPLHRRG